jgi:long-chain acyl-CoA synthetase
LLRGPNVMLGYWQKPEETAAIIRDGWLHTGDIGRLDADGYLSIEDRLKDLVIVGGANVYPAEVEQVLRRHPAVLEAAVYGQPDAVLGERVCASIVLHNSASVSAEELMSFASERLADYKLPTLIEFASELPKGPTGKVLKRVLRERNRVVASPERMRPNQNGVPRPVTGVRELEDRIIDWLAATLEVDRRFVTRTVPFSELGITSLMAVELAGKLCGWLGRSVAPTITWQFSTVESLVRHCCSENHTQKAAIPVPVLAPTTLSQHAIDAMSEADAVALLRDELTRVNWSGSVA